MRILTLTNMYPPHHYGGYELSCRDVMERWIGRGHDVTVLTTNHRVAAVKAVTDDAERHVRRELEFYWSDHELVSPPPLRRLAVERHNQRVLQSALDEVRPDVVSVWNMGAMSLGLLATVADRRLPMVFVVCDDWLCYGPRLDAWTRMVESAGPVGRALSRIVGLPARLPDLGDHGAFCFVSSFTRARAAAESRWSYPHNGVVLSGIERAAFPLASTAPPDERPWDWRLLYVGRLDERKGVACVIRAMTRLPGGASLRIVGRGDVEYEAMLHALVRELGLQDRVEFHVAERSTLVEWYRAADVFIFPSEWDEPFGLTPVEAMACDTPVVATGTGGSGEFLVDERNCLRFTPRDDRALALAIERLASDPALRRHLVEGGRRTAAELDTDRLADVLEAWHVSATAQFCGDTPPDRRVTA